MVKDGSIAFLSRTYTEHPNWSIEDGKSPCRRLANSIPKTKSWPDVRDAQNNQGPHNPTSGARPAFAKIEGNGASRYSEPKEFLKEKAVAGSHTSLVPADGDAFADVLHDQSAHSASSSKVEIQSSMGESKIHSESDVQVDDLCASSLCSTKNSERSNSSMAREASPLPLPVELVDKVLSHLPMHNAAQLRLVSSFFKAAISRRNMVRRGSTEGTYSPISFTTDNLGDLHWQGYNALSKQWTTLPSLNFAREVLRSPDPELFKDYLVAGGGGLLCLNIGKFPGCEVLIVCNPLTQNLKVLPSLKFSRHPVLMHLRMDGDQHYKVVVAGSATIGSEKLSLITEQYSSETGTWTRPQNSDLPCSAFGLNEYQNGVHFTEGEKEYLLCVAILNSAGRGVMAYDLKAQKWVRDKTNRQLPFVDQGEAVIPHLATTQLVECGGSVYVFSEQEVGRNVYFCIHKMNYVEKGDRDGGLWTLIVQRKRTVGRGLLVYPEFTCVPVSEHELCIFNTVEHTIDIINLISPTDATLLRPPLKHNGNRFHCLNPIGFVFEPTFIRKVCPMGCAALVTSTKCSECDAATSLKSLVEDK